LWPAFGVNDLPIELLRVIRLAQVRALTGLGAAQLSKMEKQGRFPARLRLGIRCCGWIQAEVHGWLLARLRDRDLREEERRTGRLTPAARYRLRVRRGGLEPEDDVPT
jgi:prophage regulatory protein